MNERKPSQVKPNQVKLKQNQTRQTKTKDACTKWGASRAHTCLAVAQEAWRNASSVVFWKKYIFLHNSNSSSNRKRTSAREIPSTSASSQVTRGHSARKRGVVVRGQNRTSLVRTGVERREASVNQNHAGRLISAVPLCPLWSLGPCSSTTLKGAWLWFALPLAAVGSTRIDCCGESTWRNPVLAMSFSSPSVLSVLACAHRSSVRGCAATKRRLTPARAAACQLQHRH